MKTISNQAKSQRHAQEFISRLNPEEFIDQNGDVWRSPNSNLWPSLPCTIKESERECSFTFNLPGLSEKDIKIELGEQTLTVSGVKTQAHSHSAEDWDNPFEEVDGRLSERYQRNFFRSFLLPEKLRSKEIDINYEHETLTIVVPRSTKKSLRYLNSDSPSPKRVLH